MLGATSSCLLVDQLIVDCDNNPNVENKLPSLITSNNWNLYGSPIFINDTDPNFNWSKTESENDWCSGSGTWNDPYIIENVTIIGPSTQTSIEIRNSNLPFEIRNCNLTNTEAGNWVHGIMFDNVSNGLIIKNTCSFNFGFGIYLLESTNNTISNNIVNNNYDGIQIGKSSNNNTFKDNKCNSNQESGIAIYDSDLNNFFRNYVSNSREAITIHGFNNSFSENIIEGSGFNLQAYDSYDYSGIYNEISSHTIDTSNLVNSKPVYYYVSQNNLQNENVSNPGQIILIDSFHCSFTNLNLSDSSDGIYIFGGGNNTISNCLLRNIGTESIYLHFSNNNTILDNRITNSSVGIKGSNSHSNKISLNHIDYCGAGISLDNCNFNNISQSTVNRNSQGIGLRYSTENIIENNQIKYNNYGIALSFGADNNVITGNLIQFNIDTGISCINTDNNDNLIYHNFFVGNEQHATNSGINNRWDNGTIGNYWDDYTGVDNNGDGIGDTQFNFGTGIDFYPIYRARPAIIINLPIAGGSSINPPNFAIEVSGTELDTIWYTLNLGANIFVIQNNGTIDPSAWNDLPDGNVRIRFYVNDTLGIYIYQEVMVIKGPDVMMTIIIVIAIVVISAMSIIVWKRKFSGKALFLKDPEKLKVVKKKLLELGTQFEHLRVKEISERCGVLERSVVSILKDMIKNNEIYAKYHEVENLVEFDQQLITQEIDQLMETYRQWEEREFGKKI